MTRLLKRLTKRHVNALGILTGLAIVISILLAADGARISNSDPITGQAAWYDLRVSIEKAAPDEAGETSPRFEPTKPPLLANAELETSP